MSKQTKAPPSAVDDGIEALLSKVHDVVGPLVLYVERGGQGTLCLHIDKRPVSHMARKSTSDLSPGGLAALIKSFAHAWLQAEEADIVTRASVAKALADKALQLHAVIGNARNPGATP